MGREAFYCSCVDFGRQTAILCGKVNHKSILPQKEMNNIRLTAHAKAYREVAKKKVHHVPIKRKERKKDEQKQEYF